MATGGTAMNCPVSTRPDDPLHPNAPPGEIDDLDLARVGDAAERGLGRHRAHPDS